MKPNSNKLDRNQDEFGSWLRENRPLPPAPPAGQLASLRARLFPARRVWWLEGPSLLQWSLGASFCAAVVLSLMMTQTEMREDVPTTAESGELLELMKLQWVDAEEWNEVAEFMALAE